MSVVLSPEMYALLQEIYETATSQLAAMEKGLEPSSPQRVAILEKMLVDLGRIIRPEQVPLN